MLHQPVAQRQDVALQRHEVGIGFAVQHHQIDRQAAESPPRLGAQQGMDQRQPAGGLDAHQHDGLVARNSEAPQLALVQRPGHGIQPGRAVHQGGGQVLHRQMLFGCQGQVAQPDLRQRGSHLGGAHDVHGLQVLVDARDQFVFRLRGRRGKAQARHGAGRQPQGQAQAGYRVQAVDRVAVGVHGLVPQRGPVLRLVAPGKNPAVGDAIERQQVGIGLGQEMRDRHLRVAMQARHALEQQGAPLRLPAGLHEQVGKRRMGFVGARVGQHRLEARHQFNDAFGPAGVAQ